MESASACELAARPATKDLARDRRPIAPAGARDLIDCGPEPAATPVAVAPRGDLFEQVEHLEPGYLLSDPAVRAAQRLAQLFSAPATIAMGVQKQEKVERADGVHVAGDQVLDGAWYGHRMVS